MFPVVIDRECRDVSDNFVALDRVAGCVESSLVAPTYTSLYGRTGLGWVDIGSSAVPQPTACEAGHVSREDGWTWTCVVRKGQHLLVKTRPWRRPAQITFRHTASPKRAAVTISANTPLTGCRLTASDMRLLGRQAVRLKGMTAKRPISTAGVRPGTYRLDVGCAGSGPSAGSDLLVRADGSMLLRSDCIDAWHDSKYGDAVPGYGRRMTMEAATSASAACTALAPLTADEYQQAGREAYLRIGQIAEREVRRVSAADGIPICEAIAKVFKPVDTVGRPVRPWPTPELGTTVPVAGYLIDGFFPILYRQWDVGPVRMDNVVNCASGNQSLRLAAGTWRTCHALPLPESAADPHQMYPIYVFDRPSCPPSYPTQEIAQSSVCIVWGDRIGNNTVGGVGRVFAAVAFNASSTGSSVNASGDQAFDCQDRALRAGQFANVDVDFARPLT